MTVEFYGATLDARARINRLLGIHATGHEQDWEIEFSNPQLIEKMLEVFRAETLDLDSKNALALLMISSFEEASENGNLNVDQINRAAHVLADDAEVLNRMHFYWQHLGRANNPELVERLLSRSN
jgi:hypothetical protein